MDVDGDGGRREFGLRGQRRGTGSDKGTAANPLCEYHAHGLNPSSALGAAVIAEDTLHAFSLMPSMRIKLRRRAASRISRADAYSGELYQALACPLLGNSAIMIVRGLQVPSSA